MERVSVAAQDVSRAGRAREVWLPPELGQQMREMEAQAREHVKAGYRGTTYLEKYLPSPNSTKSHFDAATVPDKPLPL